MSSRTQTSHTDHLLTEPQPQQTAFQRHETIYNISAGRLLHLHGSNAGLYVAWPLSPSFVVSVACGAVVRAAAIGGRSRPSTRLNKATQRQTIKKEQCLLLWPSMSCHRDTSARRMTEREVTQRGKQHALGSHPNATAANQSETLIAHPACRQG
jgi:hypothetical protein